MRQRPVSGHLPIDSDRFFVLVEGVCGVFLSFLGKQWQITNSYSSPRTIPIDSSKCTGRQYLGIACLCVMHLFYLLVFFSGMGKKNFPRRSGRALTGEEANGTLRLDTSELDSLALFLEYL